MQHDSPPKPLCIADETAAGGLQLHIDIVRSARRRSLAIHVSPLGAVEVRAPPWADAQAIADFLGRHRQWVMRKLADVQANPPWVPHWGDGGHWYWLGETVALAAGGPRGGCLADGVLSLPLTAAHDDVKWQRAVLLWHRRTAAELLRTRAKTLFATHCAGHRLRNIDLRWMRATWGTCNARRAADGGRDVTLRLNLWLAALPPALADAILLHELAHVEHMNHGAGFYQRLAALNPDWRTHDEALKYWSRLLFPVAAR